MEKNRIMEHVSNKQKAEQISQNHKNFYYLESGTPTTSALECYHSAMEMAEWKDEQFAKEKKEIDEQWKRLMAESKSIGVDLLQRKDEQFENAINEIKANIIEKRDNKEYYETSKESTLNWILRLIDECCESISIQKGNKL